MNKFYDNDHKFDEPLKLFDMDIVIIDADTFSAAQVLCKNNIVPCCLNFASHKRPGGGYMPLMGTKRPIGTQEEDLFRRSNLPSLLDNDEMNALYP